MKILNVEQGSPEWLRLRREKIGASEIAIVCGHSPYMKPWELWEQKIMGTHTYENDHMKRGKEVESWVRSMRFYTEHFSNPTMLHDEYDWMLGSFDGYSKEKGIIYEVKSLSQDKIKEIMRTKKIPLHWQYQATQLSMIADLPEVRFLLCSGIGGDIEEFRYLADPQLMADIHVKGWDFYDKLQKGIPILKPVVDEDISILDDCEELWMIQQQIGNLDDLANRIKDRLKEKAKDKSLTCGEYTFRRSVRKGTVNYADVPELIGVDLDPYRRHETVTFTLIKE